MNQLLKEIEQVHTRLAEITDRCMALKAVPAPVAFAVKDLRNNARKLCMEIDRQQRNQFLAARGAALIPPEE